MKSIAALLLALCLCAALTAPAAAEVPAILQPFLDAPEVFAVYNPNNTDGEAYSGGDTAGIVTTLTNNVLAVPAPEMGEGSYVIGRFCLLVHDAHSDDYRSVPGMMLTVVSPTVWNFEVVSLITGDDVYSFYVGDTIKVAAQGGMNIQLIQIVFDEDSKPFLSAMDTYFHSARSLSEANALPLDALFFGDRNFYKTLAEDTMMDYNVLVMIGHEILLQGTSRMLAAGQGNAVIKGYPVQTGSGETIEAE